ncbi:conserved hypothetical protein [Candidatus Phytoplasma solani]|nr:conserved hypothetical protein [Candidatus Phytoplasma solani]
MHLRKILSKYIFYIFYILIMVSINIVIVKFFLFYQNQNQNQIKIKKLNQKHFDEMKKQIKNLESNLTDLKISINEFLEKKQQQIENLESQKEIQKQKNIIKPTNFNKNFKEITK